MTKKCLGCGSVLQTTNPDIIGFTPDLNNTYCKRCFRLKNYGEKKEGNIIFSKDIIARINSDSGLVVFITDYLNITKEIVSVYKSIKIPKIFVISKTDILRKDMKKEKIKLWLQKVYDIDEVYFISNDEKYNYFSLFKYMSELGFNKAFLVGITNAGKSTFINKLLKENNINKEIVTSSMPNTTIDFIDLKIDKYHIIDTPGFNYATLNYSIVLNREIKPITFNLKGSTTIVINNTWKVYFEESNNVTLYLKTDNVKREYKNTCEYDYKASVSNNHDLIIPGFGYINIKKECEVITNFKVTEIRPDLSGVDYE